jgi:uncharacterized protein
MECRFIRRSPVPHQQEYCAAAPSRRFTLDHRVKHALKSQGNFQYMDFVMPNPRLLLPLSWDGIHPETDRPAPEKVISGDPVHTTWNIEDNDGLYCGLWQSTPGKWKVSYAEWEYIRILTGVSVLTGVDGKPVTLRRGDSHIIRPGFKGTWEVLETTVKEYVIRL